MANSIRRYEGRVVAVVGGGSGLGEGFAHRFAREGADVAVLDLDADRGSTVADSLAGYGSVGPTYVRTPLTVPAIPEEAWETFGAEHALGRVASIEDIAALVAFLGSDEASIITGAFYLADGGYTAR